jgi:hypothetical protein
MPVSFEEQFIKFSLHLQISRSLSSGNGTGAVLAMISPTEAGAPGSPYRMSSSSISALNSKPSLSKELMQKLRSMTETIKMLSDENAQLRTQNEEILRTRKHEELVGKRNYNGLYDDLEKKQLADLVVSYDEKLKSLSFEVSDLQKRLRAADDAHREVEAATQTTKSAAEKDKYKQLSRRLKEERNNYRDSLECKQQEQANLKVEMEKMSELISELRVNCQSLQVELTVCRQITTKERHDVAVQAVLVGETTSRPSTRKLSTSSITQESIRKARSVYGAKQPKPARCSALTNGLHNSSSSSMTSLKDQDVNNKPRYDRATSMSPSKPASNGPRIAKPVSRMNNKNKIPAGTNTYASPGFQSKLPLSPASTISSMSSPKTIISRIPQPGTPSPRKSRIPSAPRYNTPPSRQIPRSPATMTLNSPLKSPRPVTQSPMRSSASMSVRSQTFAVSPPPPPPPTEMHTEVEQLVSDEVDEVEQPSQVEASPSPLPSPSPSPQPPPPAPPVSSASRLSQPQNKSDHLSESEVEEEEEEEEDEEILRVSSDGVVEMTSSSRGHSSHQESPIVPSVIGKSSYSHNSSGSEENPSADDEGSRDGDSKPVSVASSPVECTPRTKKKVEHFRQGLAARRIQRTWKHFYEELEERKDVSLPAPLVQGIFIKKSFQKQIP